MDKGRISHLSPALKIDINHQKISLDSNFLDKTIKNLKNIISHQYKFLNNYENLSKYKSPPGSKIKKSVFFHRDLETEETDRNDRIRAFDKLSIFQIEGFEKLGKQKEKPLSTLIKKSFNPIQSEENVKINKYNKFTFNKVFDKQLMNKIKIKTSVNNRENTREDNKKVEPNPIRSKLQNLKTRVILLKGVIDYAYPNMYKMKVEKLKDERTSRQNKISSCEIQITNQLNDYMNTTSNFKKSRKRLTYSSMNIQEIPINTGTGFTRNKPILGINYRTKSSQSVKPFLVLSSESKKLFPKITNKFISNMMTSTCPNVN